MLKWTASAQKLPPADTSNTVRTPIQLRSDAAAKRRCRRRATIGNKENIPIVTSTPMASVGMRQRNSPLADILNLTPDRPRTPTVRNIAQKVRRHSTLGLTVTVPVKAGYASTLPRYEEEYSPSTMLPTGQQLALRGLLPDAMILGNPRYFKTPELTQPELKPVLPKKRKLDQEFTEIAKEAAAAAASQQQQLNATATSSAKMGDQTLDHLIDAILDSARKEEKKRKPRKSFNLRRRTLLRNQVETISDLMLSPSYTPCDDPADDLSFLVTENASKALTTPVPYISTPSPATPPVGIALTTSVLCKLPTPATVEKVENTKRRVNDTFMLDTPVRSLAQKRPRHPKRVTATKRFKVDTRNYFEIGLALPSIYV